jgi:CBS domain containing-hemolysin-like protein
LGSESALTLIFLAAALVLFFALHAAEAALPLLRRSHIREMLPEKGLREAAVRNLRASRYAYEDVIRIVRLTVIGTSFALALAVLWIQLDASWIVTLLGMTGLWAIKLMFRPLAVKLMDNLADTVLLQMAVLVQFSLWPVLPLARISSVATQPSRRTTEQPSNVSNGQTFVEPSKDEASVEEEIADEVLEPAERRMIYAILHLEDTAVREISVPRVDMVALEINTPLDQAVERMLESGHSRLPVFEGSLDSVVGILYSRDLLEATATKPSVQMRLHDMVRPPFFVPEAKRADKLLREFQERRVHMAIVVDEYGGVAGLVTIEDLIEEIVGEIEDEFDTSYPTIETGDDGEALVDARIEVDAFNKAFNADIAGEGFETLGGFLYSKLGKIPNVGDTVVSNVLQMEVVTTVGRRIKKVRVLHVAVVADEKNPPSFGREPRP